MNSEKKNRDSGNDTFLHNYIFPCTPSSHMSNSRTGARIGPSRSNKFIITFGTDLVFIQSITY